MRTCREMRDSDGRRLFRSRPGRTARDGGRWPVCIGPPPSRESYLSVEKILAAAQSTRGRRHSSRLWLSLGKCRICRRRRAAGLLFVGPRAHSIAAMGDKTAAENSSGRPASRRPRNRRGRSVRSEVEEFCDRYGFPVLLKAAAGGGGKGMRIVRSRANWLGAFADARSEAMSAFGDDRLYVEEVP